MNNPPFEEWAALDAIGLLDEAEQKALHDAAKKDPAVRRLLETFADSATLLAYDAPHLAPPPAVKGKLMRKLPRQAPAPAQPGVSPRPQAAPQPAKARNILAFPPWIPYALAACLLGLCVYQASLISGLKARVRSVNSDLASARQRNDLDELRLASLEARDPAYNSAKVMVAWDPRLHRGLISMHDLPPPPPGHDYQLWVLDPKELAPVSAGLLTRDTSSEGFEVHPVSTTGPGFAISLEPAGGRPSPTGAILFAVAPGH